MISGECNTHYNMVMLHVLVAKHGLFHVVASAVIVLAVRQKAIYFTLNKYLASYALQQS